MKTRAILILCLISTSVFAIGTSHWTHTSEADFTDTERTPKNLLEVEAEAVALLCCEALNLEGADYCRGYIRNWLCPAIGYNGDAIPEKSAQKIFRTADQILRAGRLQAEQHAEA